MKKNKSEILLVIAIIAFIAVGLYFFKQSKTIVTTAEIPYSKNGNVNYKVYLNDKSYYNKDFLDEGMQYISSIIDYIDLNYNFVAEYEGVDSYEITKKITTHLSITDAADEEKIIYSKDETLKEEKTKKDNLGITDNVKIDYGKYNGLANSFKTSYGINANCLLKVNYSISYVNTDNGLSSSDTFTVNIPLSEQMINIEKSNGIAEQSIYLGETKESALNKVMFIVALIFWGMSLVFVLLLVLQIINRRKKESAYDRFLTKTLKEFDSYITEAKETAVDESKKVIKINSFKELLDVRNNVEKAIIYTRIDNNTSKFQIIDNEIYEFVARRSEMDK